MHDVINDELGVSTRVRKRHLEPDQVISCLATR